MSAQPQLVTLADHLALETEQEPREPVQPSPIGYHSNAEIRAWHDGYNAALLFATALIKHQREPR